MELFEILRYFILTLFLLTFTLFTLTVGYHLYLYWRERKIAKIRNILIPELVKFIFEKNNRDKVLALINKNYEEALEIVKDYLKEITGESHRELCSLFLASPKIKKLQKNLYSFFGQKRIMAAIYLAELGFHSVFNEFVLNYEKARSLEEKYFYLKGMVKLALNQEQFNLILAKIKTTPFSLADIAGILANAPEEMVPFVFLKLKEEKETKYKILYIEFLKSRNFPELAFWLCEEGVKDTDQEVLITVIKALGSWGLPRAIPVLQQFLNHENWVIRAQAAKSLGLLRINEAIPALAEKLQDENWWVRYNAGNALLNFGTEGYKTLQEILETSPDRFAKDMAGYLRTKYLFLRGLKYGAFYLKNI